MFSTKIIITEEEHHYLHQMSGYLEKNPTEIPEHRTTEIKLIGDDKV